MHLRRQVFNTNILVYDIRIRVGPRRPWVVPQSEGLRDSNHCSCTPRLVLRGFLVRGSRWWKKAASRAVEPLTAKLAPWRKLPSCASDGGTNGRPRCCAN